MRSDASPSRHDDPRILAEQVALAYGQGVASQVVGLLNVALVALVLWPVASHRVLLGWAALMTAISVARSVLTWSYRRATPAVTDAGVWRRRFVAGAFATGIGWGVAGVLLFPVVSLAYQVFLTYVLGGMAVGAAAVMAPVVTAYWAFLPPITIPVIVQLVLRGDAMGMSMAFMFTACTAMFMSSARQMHQSIRESIRLRFENLDLVDDLSAAKNQAEVLLTEIHHRVKNNLQVISSLLSLQSRAIADPEARSLFTDSQVRVRSMALVHEKLYQSPNLAHVDFAAYARELASHLTRVYRRDGEPVRVRVDAGPVGLSIEQAVPCGLVVGELLSNALKYAFPDGRAGTVAIEMSRDAGGMHRLVVRDDGVGLPPGLDVRNARSLGLRIVATLTDQLGGTLAATTAGGTTFELTLPLEDHDAREPERRAAPHR
jgi:two-component sensor histidine kinase